MNNFGFIRVALAIPQVEVANCRFNTTHIEALIKQASEKQVQILCFPELSITAYTCGDLFHQELLLDEAEKQLLQLVKNTAHLPVLSIVGLPIRFNNTLYNVAVVFQQGQILGVVPKTYLNNNDQSEQRWFSSADSLFAEKIRIDGHEIAFGTNLLFKSGNICFAIEISEDLWAPVSPSSSHTLAGANIIFNLSATNDLIAKNDYLNQLIQQQSAKCIAGYIYASAGFGESTTDLVFAGNGYIVDNGSILASSERFSFEEQIVIGEIDVERLINERQRNKSFIHNAQHIRKSYRIIAFALADYRFKKLSIAINPHPFIPLEKQMGMRCCEIFNIQVSALATRIKRTGVKTVTLGISGGLDSTLALLVCVKTFDKLQIPREHIIGVTMPGFGTTNRTYNNAVDLMKLLGVTIREISIKEACIRHFKDIGHAEDVCDAVYENSQARERTQILMDIANQTGGLVVGTGDLSELALGWATYNGDHMSMYGVNAGVPKTLMRYLVQWVALSENETIHQILLNILKTPISPELLPANDNNISQQTEDIVGPYELHDFFLYYTVRFGFRPAKIFFLVTQAFDGKYDKTTLKKWMMIFFMRFFNQQFKRSCLPDGPKVGSVSLSPRGDWCMPSDASSEIWLKEIAEL